MKCHEVVLRHRFLGALAAFALLLQSCEEKSSQLTAGHEYAHLTGVVKYADDLNPVNNAFVRTESHLETTTTDSVGAYDLALDLLENAQEAVVLQIFKEGYLMVAMDAVIKAGETTLLPTVTLERYLDSTLLDTTISGSGEAVGLALISLAPETLSLAGAGGTTASQIVCEARDASGNPVDSLHTTQINFDLLADPGGGAYVFPSSLVTDKYGRVATTFYAGTLAGVAIVRAKFASSDVSVILPDITLYQTGDPASINLIYLQFDSIAVAGGGANETSTMTFEVRDAGGSPLTLDAPVEVLLEILGATGGGEYLYPTSATTDALGQVSTTLNSGTVSGAVQVRAYLSGDTAIACTPIPLAIHSGLPELTHFGVVPQWLNFPGFSYYGLIDTLSAMVGDRYANPVPLGTAVYFTSDAGIIQGSASTNDDGFAPVRLYSGPPSPPASYPFGTITAQTVGEGGQILTATALVLFSGVTQIYDLNPNTFAIPNGGLQVFTFRVSDQNGYPLAHGTQISVEPSFGAVLGDVDILFPDTQSQSWTYFSFVLFDTDAAEGDPPNLVALSISVTSPNGDATVVITGTLD